MSKSETISMEKLKIFINNKFVDIKDAKVSVFDRGFLYGDGIFETMRSYQGVVFKLDEHLARLFASLKIMRIKISFSKDYFKKIILKTLRVNELDSAYIRLTVTRGEGRFGISYEDKFVPNIIVVAKEFEGYPNWMYVRGIHAKVVGIRQNEFTPTSGIKSLNFLNYIMARLDAKSKGFDEAILMNTKGYISEAATSNIFLTKKKVLIAPSLDSGILPGITRAVIIRIAKRLKMSVKEKKVSYKELLVSDEAFLTNSLAEVIPVTMVDSKKIGPACPGSVTKLLHISYQKEVMREVMR